MMGFQISGLSAKRFEALYGLPDDELRRRGVLRYTVAAGDGYPDRIELREARPGETVLLLNFVSQDAATPYRASHAIFVREGARESYVGRDVVPDLLRARLLSVRGFSADGMLLEADVVEGTGLERVVDRLFRTAEIAYLHVHNAREGCYHARVDRAG